MTTLLTVNSAIAFLMRNEDRAFATDSTHTVSVLKLGTRIKSLPKALGVRYFTAKQAAARLAGAGHSNCNTPSIEEAWLAVEALCKSSQSMSTSGIAATAIENAKRSLTQ